VEIKFYNVGAACCLFKVNNKLKIACDPALGAEGTLYKFKTFDSTRMKPPMFNNSLFDDVNLWLITHNHLDHLDKAGVEKINSDSIIIVHKNVLATLSPDRYKKIVPLDWNQTHEIRVDNYTISIKAIPAFHAGNFIVQKLAGGVNGYYLKISDGTETYKIYFTSDTLYNPKIVKALSNEKIDVMVANLGEVRSHSFGGPLTMSALILKRIVNELKPTMVIPVHYDEFSHYETSEEELICYGFYPLEQGKWIDLSEIRPKSTIGRSKKRMRDLRD